MSAEPAGVFRLTILLAAVTPLISALEALFNAWRYRQRELIDWSVTLTTSRHYAHGRTARVLDGLLRYPNVLALVALQAVCAAALLTRLAPGPVETGLLVANLLLCVGFTVREPYGRDGADQMAIIVLFAASCAAVHPTEFTRTAALWFVALQAALSYFTAGVAKACSAAWRSGDALPLICATEMYGNFQVAGLLRRFPLAARGLAWSTILYETLFPVVFFVPGMVALLILAGGLFFHAVLARIMGLNTFFWSFLATYPALFYCSRHGWMH